MSPKQASIAVSWSGLFIAMLGAFVIWGIGGSLLVFGLTCLACGIIGEVRAP